MSRLVIARVLIPVFAGMCLLPFISSGMALLIGVLIALTCGNPYLSMQRFNLKKLTTSLLQLAVVGLGAGMNLSVVAAVGIRGIGYTAVGILLTMLLGLQLGRILKTSWDSSVLITVGTAICGGSAIAAVAPIIRARSQEVTIALGTVFLLNSIALFIFPTIGHALALTQVQFGLWSALAIHDTSSVVGASLAYGPEAVTIATTVKLARALWIVPVSLAIGAWMSRASRANSQTSDARPKIKKLWFILGFLVMAFIVTLFPALRPAGDLLNTFSKRLLVVTLFLIGSSLTRDTLKQVGFRPLVHGAVLWFITALSTLAALKLDWIS